jgi:TRAP transporter TAXI family solute receptor
VRPTSVASGSTWPAPSPRCAPATSTRSSGWAHCPTTTVDELAAAEPVRLLDLDPLLDALRDRYPVYAPGTVLAGTYRIDDPVATLLVRNVLLVDAGLDADLVEAMTGALFADQQRLADAIQAARTVDARSAVLTQPVPLHDGALRWFSDDAMA